MADRVPFPPDEWLVVIRAWAATVAQVDRVWIIGSRATGIRRPRDDRPPVPDLDIAYTLAGDDAGQLVALAMADGAGWRRQLSAEIPVPIDLQLADQGDTRVWVMEHGVLVYER